MPLASVLSAVRRLAAPCVGVCSSSCSNARFTAYADPFEALLAAPLREDVAVAGTEGLGVLLRVLCRELPVTVGVTALRPGVEELAVAAASGAEREARGGVGVKPGEELCLFVPVRRLALAATPVAMSLSACTDFLATWGDPVTVFRTNE